MTTIITGNFQQQEQAKRAISALKDAEFESDRIATFFVNPPGQHDLYPIGGDSAESRGTAQAPEGTAHGAGIGGAVGAAVGIAAAPILGPAAAIAGTGAGAYVGSLYGALGNTADNKNNPPTQAPYGHTVKTTHDRRSGMLVATAVVDSAQAERASSILRSLGAEDIERTEGNIRNGDWTDFDPLRPLNVATP